MTLELEYTNKVLQIAAAISKSSDKHTIVFKNTPTVLDALELLKNSSFKEFFNKKTICAILFETRNDLADASLDDIKKANLSEHKAIVVGFLNEPINCFKLFWKLKDIQFVWTELEERKFDMNGCNVGKTFRFIAELLMKSVSKEKSAISSPYDEGKNYVELANIIDEKGFNLLLAAVDHGDLEIVRFFLKFIDVNCEFKRSPTDIETPIRLAFRNDNVPMIHLLLMHGSLYPTDFLHRRLKFETENHDLKNFLGELEELHELIDTIKEDVDFDVFLRFIAREEDYENLTKSFQRLASLLSQYYHLPFCFNTSNVSLMHHALKLKKIKLFEHLSETMSFGPNENHVAAEHTQSKCANFEKSKNFPSHHLDKLMAHSEVFDHGEYFVPTPMQKETVRKAFIYLDGIEETRVILELVAAHANFTLLFITEHEDVSAVTYKGEYTYGIFYWRQKKIAIGAKKLLGEDFMNKIAQEGFELDTEVLQVIGTLKHELCHFAVLLVFRNLCKPFSLGCKEDFARVLEVTKEKSFFNDNERRIIGSVFNGYSVSQQEAELIVRPAQIYAEFHGKRDELQEFRRNFTELFDFFEMNFMLRVKSAIAVVKRLSDSSVTFGDLTEDMKKTVQNSLVSLQGFSVQLVKLINPKQAKEAEIEDALSCLTKQQILDIMDEKKVLAIGREISPSKTYIHREFLLVKNPQVKPVDLAFVAERAKESNILILQDKRGAGKSTTLNYASSFLKTSNPTKWIVKIDKKVLGNVRVEATAKFFIEHVIKSGKNPSEEKLFSRMFARGDVIIFWDHFELEDIKDVVLDISKNTNCEQWLTIWDWDDAKIETEGVYKFTEMTEKDVLIIQMNVRKQYEEKVEY